MAKIKPPLMIRPYNRLQEKLTFIGLYTITMYISFRRNKIKVVSPAPARLTLETYRSEILHFIPKSFQELEQENSRLLSTTTPAPTSTIRPSMYQYFGS